MQCFRISAGRHTARPQATCLAQCFRASLDRYAREYPRRDQSAGASSSYRPQHAGHRARELLPFRGFAGKLLLALRRESIELRFSVVFRRPMLEGNPAALYQAMESWVEGSFFDEQHVFGVMLDSFGDGVAVRGTESERA